MYLKKNCFKNNETETSKYWLQIIWSKKSRDSTFVGCSLGNH